MHILFKILILHSLRQYLNSQFVISMVDLLGKVQQKQVHWGTWKAKIVVALLSVHRSPPSPSVPNAQRFSSHSRLQNCEWDSLKHTWEWGILLLFHRQWLWNFFCTAALHQQKRWRMFPPKISSSQEIKWLSRGGKWEAEFPQEEKETKSVFHTSRQEPLATGLFYKGGTSSLRTLK